MSRRDGGVAGPIGSLVFILGAVPLAFAALVAGGLQCDESCDGGPWYERAGAVEWKVMMACGLLAALFAWATVAVGYRARPAAALVWWGATALLGVVWLGMAFQAFQGDSKTTIVGFFVLWLACGLGAASRRPTTA